MGDNMRAKTCAVCGALVKDRTRHDQWHYRLVGHGFTVSGDGRSAIWTIRCDCGWRVDLNDPSQLRDRHRDHVRSSSRRVKRPVAFRGAEVSTFSG